MSNLKYTLYLDESETHKKDLITTIMYIDNIFSYFFSQVEIEKKTVRIIGKVVELRAKF